MSRKFLSGLFGVVVALNCLGAAAMPAGDAAMYSAANAVAHGSHAAEFVQGGLVRADFDGVALATAAAQASNAAAYFSQNAVVTLGILALVALALIGSAVVGKVIQRTSGREAHRTDAWRETLLEMLEADLTNLDSMTHGFSGR